MVKVGFIFMCVCTLECLYFKVQVCTHLCVKAKRQPDSLKCHF